MLDYSQSLEYVVKSDIGMRRANNQDSCSAVVAEDDSDWQQRGHLFIVADGMGAHAAGELASKIAVDTVPHLYRHYRSLPAPDALRRAIEETNREIHVRGRANVEFHNMGTTASVLVLLPQGVICGHVGDSRVYRVRNQTLEQLTFDHSLAWELKALGKIDAESDFAKHVPKNVITRSLGPQPNVQVDIEGAFPVQEGDVFLLCSDGLSGQVDDPEIGAIIANLPPEEAANVLIDLANLRGGPDNITVIIAKVVGSQLATNGESQRSFVGQRKKQAVNPAAWVVSGVCLFVGLFLWVASQPILASVFGVAGIVALIVGIVMLVRQRTPQASRESGGFSKGNGPYTQFSCTAGREFVSKLATIVSELREAAEEANWEIQWSQFQEFNDAAVDAAKAGRHTDAVRSFCKAISFMMNELRHQQSQQASDSAIEY